MNQGQFEAFLRNVMQQGQPPRDDDSEAGDPEDDEEEVEEGEIEEVDDDEVEDGVVDDGEDEDEDGDGQGQMQLTPDQLMRLLMGQPLNFPGGPGGGPSTAAAVAEDRSIPKEWSGLHSLPAATQKHFQGLLAKLRAKNLSSLHIMVLGRPGAGKTSTVNTLLNEKVSAVTALAAQSVEPPQPYVRKVPSAGFTLTITDTQGITAQDAVNPAAVAEVTAFLQAKNKENPVDLFLFCERLDQYRVEPLDRDVIRAYSDALGPQMWRRAVLVLTRGGLKSLPAGLGYDAFVSKRAAQVQAALRRGGCPLELPLAVVENLRTGFTPAGEKALPNGEPVLGGLVARISGIVDKSQGPYVYDAKIGRRSDPNRRRKWLIPLVLAAQWALKTFVIDRILEEDGLTGDQFGPFSDEVVAEKRERRAMKKEEEEEEKKKEGKKAAPAAAKPAAARAAAPAKAPSAGPSVAAPVVPKPAAVVDESDDEDEDDEDDE